MRFFSIYKYLGIGYQPDSPITSNAVAGENGGVIKPRTEKTKTEQTGRARSKAEVFTPSWICDKQNNLVDNAWVGKENETESLKLEIKCCGCGG